jgi:hypothetical protein
MACILILLQWKDAAGGRRSEIITTVVGRINSLKRKNGKAEMF